MPTLDQIRAAEVHMNAAKDALLNYIAAPQEYPDVARNDLLAELTDAQNQFMDLIRERMKQQK